VIGSNVQPLGGNSFFWLSDWAAYHTEMSAARVAVHATAALTDLAALATAILADVPRAYYKMGDAPASLIAADSSGNGFNATKNGTIVFGSAGVNNPPTPPLPPFPARAANLVATAGNNIVGAFPPAAVQTDSKTVVYAWLPNLGAPTFSAAAGTETVAISELRLLPGYAVGANTTSLDAGDQWADITLWYDDQPSGYTPYDVEYDEIVLIP
jgi:hypothetical protein